MGRVLFERGWWGRQEAPHNDGATNLVIGGVSMPSPVELYPLVVLWLQAMGMVAHPTGVRGVAEVVTAVLVTQSLRSATLMRALLSEEGVPARQRYKRLARFWQRSWLSPAWVTPVPSGEAPGWYGPCWRWYLLTLRAPVPPG